MAKGRADFAGKVFDIKKESMPKGSWWWWFWLFFFDNPGNPEKPRQLMILWSTKNEASIDCNGLNMSLGPQDDRSRMDGAVASWYFDGHEMHHDFILEPCKLITSGDVMETEGKTPTSFSVNGRKSVVKIGKDFTFNAEMVKKHEFAQSDYHSNKIIGNMNYKLLRVNHFELKGRVKGKPVKGSAYFQRVFVNAPSSSWYWGIFHLDNGGILTYFMPYAFGKSIKRDIALFDGKDMHRIKDIKVRRKAADLPAFEISGENAQEKLSFTVNSYSHSSWTFRKRALGFFPSKLVYNEYPATVSDITLLDKKTGKTTRLSGGVGNAEHTTGLLL